MVSRQNALSKHERELYRNHTIFAGEKDPFVNGAFDYFSYLQDNSKPSTIKKVVRVMQTTLALACCLDRTVADNGVEDT
jgi:hypothetical protein